LMGRTSQKPPMSKQWRLSAPPRSQSWFRFYAGPLTPNWLPPLQRPWCRTSAPRPTSLSSTSWLSPSCLPLHPQLRSWRSICCQKG
ncbi:hypothetical protein XENOCAPTIV_029413, partial [Xenoophorus captivus]